MTHKGVFYISGFQRIKIIASFQESLLRLKCEDFPIEKAIVKVWFQFHDFFKVYIDSDWAVQVAIWSRRLSKAFPIYVSCDRKEL